ncbi:MULTISPECIES: hypothetical protein [unclassified Corynebacterium]
MAPVKGDVELVCTTVLLRRGTMHLAGAISRTPAKYERGPTS